MHHQFKDFTTLPISAGRRRIAHGHTKKLRTKNRSIGKAQREKNPVWLPRLVLHFVIPANRIITVVAAWPFLYDNDGGFAYAQLSPWLHLADKKFRIDRTMYPVTPTESVCVLCMPDESEKKRISAFSQTAVASSQAVQSSK